MSTPEAALEQMYVALVLYPRQLTLVQRIWAARRANFRGIPRSVANMFLDQLAQSHLSSALSVYDLLLSLSQEMKHIWRREFSAVKALYFVIRYCTILGIFWSILIRHVLASVVSIQVCWAEFLDNLVSFLMILLKRYHDWNLLSSGKPLT